MRKKRKRIWWCVLLCLALFAGGILLTTEGRTGLPISFRFDSNCTFNPFIAEETKGRIHEIIETVANNGLLSLMGKKGYLIKLGDVVGAATTDFAYWAYVFSTPKLAQDMKKIQRSSVKYEGFIKGSQNKALRECNANPCFLQQARGFAAYLHVPEEELVAVLQECIEESAHNKYAFKKYLDYLIATH
jgi:hypothetical protein